MKWAKKDVWGNEKIWYSGEVLEKIKEFVHEVIKKRPHSDNTIFENILKIIEETNL